MIQNILYRLTIFAMAIQLLTAEESNPKHDCIKPVKDDIAISIDTTADKAEYNEIAESMNNEIQEYSDCVLSHIKKMEEQIKEQISEKNKKAESGETDDLEFENLMLSLDHTVDMEDELETLKIEQIEQIEQIDDGENEEEYQEELKDL